MLKKSQKLHLYYGSSICPKTDDDIEHHAICYGYSIEKANCDWFKQVLTILSNQKDGDGRNNFDDFFGWHDKRFWMCPKLDFSTHKISGKDYPELIFTSDHAHHQFERDTLYIDDSLVERFAKELQNDFGIEFLRFERR